MGHEAVLVGGVGGGDEGAVGGSVGVLALDDLRLFSGTQLLDRARGCQSNAVLCLETERKGNS